MSSNPTRSAAPRGRAVRPKRPLPLFYILLAVIFIAGTAAIGYFVLRPRAAATPPAQPAGVAEATPLPLSSFPAKGRADAPVTVVIYSDFQCPACGFFASQLEQAFTTKYIDTGKVRLVYHDFPLSQHQNAIPAAEAARCAADQGAFWPMHDLLFKQQYEWQNLAQPQAKFGEYAAALKLDTAKFNQCLASGTHRAEILAARADADRAGIPATPTFVIDGKQYTMQDLESGIEAALAAKR